MLYSILIAVACLMPVDLIANPKNKLFRNLFAQETVQARTLIAQENAVIVGNLTVQGVVTVQGPINGTESGFIMGPVTSTLSAVPRFANTTGTLLKDSSVLADDTGNITINGITKAGYTVSWPTIVGADGTFLGSDGAGNLI